MPAAVGRGVEKLTSEFECAGDGVNVCLHFMSTVSWILAYSNQPANTFDHARAILAIGNAKPRIARAQHLDARFPCMNQFIHVLGNIALGFQLVTVRSRNPWKRSRSAERCCGLNPHMFIETISSPVRLSSRCPSGRVLCMRSLRVRSLFNSAIVLQSNHSSATLTHPARHRAEVGKGIAQDKADHGVIGRARLQMLREQRDSFRLRRNHRH